MFIASKKLGSILKKIKKFNTYHNPFNREEMKKENRQKCAKLVDESIHKITDRLNKKY